MSKLIVEVTEICDVMPHPNADKLDIVVVKGWHVISKRNEFQKNEKVIYFPPDAVLPPEIFNGPNDEIKGRLNCARYLTPMPKNGPFSGKARVTACRLRGWVSYGLLMKLDSSFGDDLNWPIGKDVSDYFNILKYEPPEDLSKGDADKFNSRFYAYTSIEHYGNYPSSFKESEEVIFTEKIHGSNVRIGLIIEPDENSNVQWNFAVGSHSVRRKEFSKVETRISASSLEEQGFDISTIKVDHILPDNWKVTNIINYEDENGTSKIAKFVCVKLDKNGDFVYSKSIYWTCLDDNIKNLLNYIKDNFEWPEPKHSIMVYGEIYGNGIQDMQYGEIGTNFRVFDLSINNSYLDFDIQLELFNKFGINTAPVLYRGPFSKEKVIEFTSGSTTICDPKIAGKFSGREGIVIKPIKETRCIEIKGRKILKSISADYLSRRDGTEYH